MKEFLKNVGAGLAAMANSAFERKKAHYGAWHPANGALITAIENGDATGVETALKKGAKPNCFVTDTWKSGNPLVGGHSNEVPALIHAIDRKCTLPVITALLAGGADVTLRVIEEDKMAGHGRGPALLAAANSGNNGIFFAVLNATQDHKGADWADIFRHLAARTDMTDPKQGAENFRTLLAETAKHPQAAAEMVKNFRLASLSPWSHTPAAESLNAVMRETVKGLADAQTPPAPAAESVQDTALKVSKPLQFKAKP